MTVLDAAVDQARAGAYSELLVVGDPGVGKSTLLAANRAGLGPEAVIVVVAVESEREVPLAGFVSLARQLLDLTDDGAGDGAGVVDAPSRRLLESAVSTGRIDNVPATGLALAEALSSASDGRLLVVHLDDVHWLDDLSARLLRFATNQLPPCSLAIIAASRAGERSVFDTAPRVELRGMAPQESRLLLRELAPTVAAQCHDLCDGHPIALRELAQSLTADQRAGHAPLPESAPLPRRLQDWSDRRFDGLDERASAALTLIAVAGNAPQSAVVAALADQSLTLADLDTALHRGVLAADAAGLHFAHPLLRTAALDRAPASVRRRAHRSIAAALPDTETARIAWHLAEATEGDPEPAIRALSAVARAAVASGAYLTAAEAWDRVAGLRSSDAERVGDWTEAGRAWWDAGRPDLAAPPLTHAVGESSGAERATAADLLGQVRVFASSTTDAIRFLEAEARLIEHDDADLAVALYVSAARAASLAASPLAGELAGMAERVALDGSDYARAASRTIATHVRLVAGEGTVLGERLAELDELAALVSNGVDRPLLELGQLIGFDLMVRERWSESRSIFADVGTTARRAALSGVESFAAAMSAEVAWRTSDWARARSEALTESTFYDPHESLRGSFGDATCARVDGAQGRFETADESATLAVERGDRLGMASLSAWGRHARGLAALSAGRARDAVEPLMWIWRLERSGSASDPGVLWWHGDLLDTLIDLGRTADARRLVDQIGEQATTTDRVWAHAITARGRGVLDRDVGALHESIELLEGLGAPFEAARSRLAAASVFDGSLRRRVLRAALDGFEQLGAEPWAARLRPRLGLDPAPTRTASPLTAAETRVALVVAAGASNQEAAEHLNVNRRTVEAHLASAYRKLGVRNRTELALQVRESPTRFH